MTKAAPRGLLSASSAASPTASPEPPAMHDHAPLDWMHRFDLSNLDDAALHQAKRCLLDLLGVAAGATRTPLGACPTASRQWRDRRERDTRQPGPAPVGRRGIRQISGSSHFAGKGGKDHREPAPSHSPLPVSLPLRERIYSRWRRALHLPGHAGRLRRQSRTTSLPPASPCSSGPSRLVCVGESLFPIAGP